MVGIEVRELSVQFAPQPPVLDRLSLSVESGQFVALLGGSGSGKSTLLRSIARLQPISGGEVEFTGECPMRRPGDLSYVFQDATLLPWRTAEQNVRLPLELSARLGEIKPDAAGAHSVGDAVADALRSVGLEEPSWRKFPRQLSGGMRMRVSLARSIVTDPAVLLLDEPFAALDEILRARTNDLLADLWMRKSRTVLFVTHNIAEAVNLSQRMAILGRGGIARWIENPLPMPRNAQVRSSPEFAQLYAQVSTALNEAT